jgi:D-psicose/D-tagatose/L-ribulose 3-epimerase
MEFKFGVDTFIWAEEFSEKDLWIIEKAKKLGFELIDFAVADPFRFPTEAVKNELDRVAIDCVLTTTLTDSTNPISPDEDIRNKSLDALKKAVDICNVLNAPILGGVNYAAWGYFTLKPPTEQEWAWSVGVLSKAADYAKETGDVNICVEIIQRDETHLLNIAADGVRFCKDTGRDNVKVHLDCFHMIREEKSFTDAVKVCGKEYLKYIHVNENDRGIPGTGLVPFKEFFRALIDIDYDGPLVIESFDSSFEVLAGNCAIWRKLADSGEALAIEGLKNLKAIAKEVQLEYGK